MLAATVTGGSGVYAGASGALTVRIGLAGTTNFDGWTGTLTVPGLEFDVSPPVLHGVTSKTVRAPKRAKHVRVRYKVTASDAVDGSLAASCKPPSGSSFKIGRTKVTCSATDSSGNTATGRFTVTVRRK
jgi:hypothetical protein